MATSCCGGRNHTFLLTAFSPLGQPLHQFCVIWNQCLVFGHPLCRHFRIYCVCGAALKASKSNRLKQVNQRLFVIQLGYCNIRGNKRFIFEQKPGQL